MVYLFGKSFTYVDNKSCTSGTYFSYCKYVKDNTNGSHIGNLSEISPNRRYHFDRSIGISGRGSALPADSRPIIRISNSNPSHLRIELIVRPHGEKTFPIADGPEIIYILVKEKQMFGNCSRDFQQERHHANQLLKMLQLDCQLTINGY